PGALAALPRRVGELLTGNRGVIQQPTLGNREYSSALTAGTGGCRALLSAARAPGPPNAVLRSPIASSLTRRLRANHRRVGTLAHVASRILTQPSGGGRQPPR